METLQGCRVSQFPGDRCQCLKLFADWVGWEEEQEHKIDWSAVDRFKINRFV
jgi:hypothetical protein